MAKVINLTVKVDDAGFQQFMKNFNAFSAQIDQLNQKFKTINTTLMKTKTEAQGVISFITNAFVGVNKLTNAVEKTLKTFVRWGAAIGGIITMLSTGAGMFGIDRLAESIMQKRRQAMGLGTTYGGLQGVQIAGRQMFTDPAAMLAGIRTAAGGGPGVGALGGLLRGRPFSQYGGDPVQMLPDVIRFLHREIKAAPPGAEVAVGRQLTTGQGLSGFPDEVFVQLRHATDEQREALIKQMQEAAKSTDMSKKAQEGWAALNRQFELAKTALESAFGESFKKLTGPLGDLSKAVTNLVKALLDSKTVTDLIDWLTTQLNKLTKTLSEDPEAISKKIKEWDKYIEDEWMPLLKKLKDALEVFTNIISKISNAMKEIALFFTDPKEWIKQYLIPALTKNPLGGGPAPQMGGNPPGTAGVPGMPGTPAGPTGGQPAPNRNVPQVQTDPMSGLPLGPAPAPPVPGTTTSPATNVPPWQRQRSDLFMPGNFLNQQFASANLGSVTGGARTAFGAGGSSFGMGGTTTQFAGSRFGGRGVSSSIAMAGLKSGDVTIGDINRAGDTRMAGGRRTGMFASIRGGNRVAMFGGAARGRVPGNEMNFVGMRGGNVSMASADQRRFNVNQRPLDVDNWQMNRTTSLTVRNVPGSNIFTQSAGMA